ncbi:DUF5908 family protein [Segetibacter sp. 3557_3]|uniref:DUF5908 family protein n=1 Tax=Segetibacter sp. 3557_3 TaxID=2547429 RepID=UPI0014044341|nr:DUF5908 family protein [Segetibacter sp. 3557_3]
MPIQINELIIRANVVEGKETAPQEASAAPGGLNREEIIKECVAHVLEVINKKLER